MASSDDKQLRVPIGVPVETNADQAATSVDALSDAISKSKDVIRDAAMNLKNLSGKSAEVKAAKDQLKATIAQERSAITQSTLALVKQGTTQERVAAAAKKAAKEREEAAKKTSDAISRAGGPLAKVRDIISSFKDVAGEGSSATSILAFGLGSLAAVSVAAVVGVAALVGALARWAIKGADAARSMQLVREAATGSATNAENLGLQVDVLAGKVPTSVAALNDLAASLAKNRLGGQTTVDTLNAVAQANAALGDAGGAKVREIIERGKLSQRMFLGLRELEGTGLDFSDVAASLAKGMHVSVKEAQTALLEGRVKLGDGAKAMRDAVESKVGGINLRKMMSIDGLSDQVGKKFAAMTAPLAKDLDRAGAAVFKLVDALDASTPTGLVLQRAVTMFGKGMVTVIERGAPIAKQFLRGLIIGGLELYIGYLHVKNAFTSAFGPDLLKNVDGLNFALAAGKFTLGALAVTAGVLAAALALAAAPFVAIYAAMVKTQDLGEKWGKSIREYFLGIDWAASGRAIIDGLIGGITSGIGRAVDTVKDLAKKLKTTFTGPDGIDSHSPSKAFDRYGETIPQGVEGGVNRGAPRAQRAVEGMIDVPSGGGGGGVGGGLLARLGAGVTKIEATLVLQAGGTTSAQEQMKDPGTMATFAKLLKDSAAAAGLAPVEG